MYSNQDVIEETLFTVNPTTQIQTKKETRNYVYGNKGIDDIVQMKVKKYKKVGQSYQLLTTDKYYYEKDNLGSISKITSNTGAIVEQYTYTAYGKPYRWNQVQNKYTPVNGAISTIGNTRMYTGREYDREILLTYHRARYYDANLGRFTSRDPIGIQDDINLYTYTANNPMNYVDRMGTEKKLIIDGTIIFEKYFYLGERYNSKYEVKKIFYLKDHSPGGLFDAKKNKDFLNLIADSKKKQVFLYGEEYDLSDIGNFYVGINGYRSGYSLNQINTFGITGEIIGFDNGLLNKKIDFDYQDEKYDQRFYQAGYNVGISISLEDFQGNETSELIETYLKKAKFNY